MGMSSGVVGFKKPDKTWQKHKKVWDVCIEAGVSMPEETEKYFNYVEPNEKGVEVDIKYAVEDYVADMQDGFDVDLTKLPKDVTHIRFVNSY